MGYFLCLTVSNMRSNREVDPLRAQSIRHGGPMSATIMPWSQIRFNIHGEIFHQKYFVLQTLVPYAKVWCMF